jgi:hypothetical protein
MCQLSKSPDLSGDVAEDRHLCLMGKVAGGQSLEDAGGDGGSAGQSLWSERHRRKKGRLFSLLVRGTATHVAR